VFEPWSPNILPNSDESTENTPSIVQVDSDQKDKQEIGYNRKVFGTPDYMDFVTFTPERNEIWRDNKDEIIHFPNNKKDESSKKSDCKPSSIFEPRISAKKPQLWKQRSDVRYKSAIRFLRRFYKELFKKENKRIVKKRYINWSMSRIYEAMSKTLAKIIPNIYLSEDLVYFTIGILSIKNDDELICKSEIKQEIMVFLSWVRYFSKKKFNLVFKSKKVRVLWNYLVDQNKGNQNAEFIRKVIKESE